MAEKRNKAVNQTEQSGSHLAMDDDEIGHETPIGVTKFEYVS